MTHTPLKLVIRIGNNYQKEGVALKFRVFVLALALTVLLTGGCTNILDKLTKRGQEPAAPAVANTTGQTTAQNQSQEFSLKDLEQALLNSKSVKLIAQDTGQTLVLDEAKRKGLVKYLGDAGELKENNELAQVVGSAAFPAYQIKLEDKDLQLDIYDELRFGAGSNNVRHYYMEKGEVWKSLEKWMPPRTYQESMLGYLFKASKVTVKGGIFAEETDQTPARNAILRSIRSIELHSTVLPQDAADPLTINFTVSNKKYTLLVYSEYLTFNNVTYKLPQGKQNIENLLSPG